MQSPLDEINPETQAICWLLILAGWLGLLALAVMLRVVALSSEMAAL